MSKGLNKIEHIGNELLVNLVMDVSEEHNPRYIFLIEHLLISRILCQPGKSRNKFLNQEKEIEAVHTNLRRFCKKIT